MKPMKSDDTTMTNAEREQTLRQVREILLVSAGASLDLGTFTGSPRRHRAFLFAAPFVVAGFILHYLLVGVLSAAVVFAIVLKMSPAETWNERFYNLLAAYEPLDEAAYQMLLQKIKANIGKREDVENWLKIESRRLTRPQEAAAEQNLLQERLH